MIEKNNLKIELIQPRGFCFGVCHALNILDQLTIRPLFVFHEIVHNKQVVSKYQKQGIQFVETLDEIPPQSQVVISAHGAGKNIYDELEKKHCSIIDATCPFVKKVHTAAKRLESQGAMVLIIGKKGHAEVVGIQGQVKQSIVVSSPEEVDALPDFHQVGCVMQTTLSLAKVQIILNKLKEKYPNLIVPPKHTMCQATTERQQAVQEAAKRCSTILVVGDTHSSNSKELVLVAQQAGCTAYLIETSQDIDNLNLSGTIGITASASAPEEIVQEIYQKLLQQH